ncbi:senescence associated gene 20 [Beta vulgaris subsp. vulgaris]|uniref:senescence associated gene 20 n=1 Tax=Beta vulgaris subsp. vulgaris TaxID=3555 RepID=UPI0020374BF0|nr:senescence associated gene 20 [Beta vulgaris subsp. vulgaris]
MAKNIQDENNNNNKAIVQDFYYALSKGDGENVSKHLASDLEWWFHGPPQCQHMRRVLTGESAYPEFRFKPRSITTIDEDRVIVEGWEGAHAYWVHVWTLKGGLMTQFREYFNTALTVRDLRPHNSGWEIGPINEKGTLWQSHISGSGLSGTGSMPGLVLAI